MYMENYNKFEIIRQCFVFNDSHDKKFHWKGFQFVFINRARKGEIKEVFYVDFITN